MLKLATSASPVAAAGPTAAPSAMCCNRLQKANESREGGKVTKPTAFAACSMALSDLRNESVAHSYRNTMLKEDDD